MPELVGLDASREGQLLLLWRSCAAMDGEYCVRARTHVGGLGELRIPHSDCDRLDSMRIGPDDGVFVLRSSPEQRTPILSRRTTLP